MLTVCLSTFQDPPVILAPIHASDRMLFSLFRQAETLHLLHNISSLRGNVFWRAMSYGKKLQRYRGVHAKEAAGIPAILKQLCFRHH